MWPSYNIIHYLTEHRISAGMCPEPSTVHPDDDCCANWSTNHIIKYADDTDPEQSGECLQRGRHLSPSMITTFYRGTKDSVLISSISLWDDNSDIKALRRVVRMAERFVTLPPVENMAQKPMLAKAASILRDSSHPCHRLFSLLLQVQQPA